MRPSTMVTCGLSTTLPVSTSIMRAAVITTVSAANAATGAIVNAIAQRIGLRMRASLARKMETSHPAPAASGMEPSMMRRIAVAASIAASLLGGPAAAEDSLDRAVKAEMAREQVPGLALSVVHHGRIVRSSAYGYGNLEWKARVTPRTRFEIASVSQMFTGAAVRLLVEAGQLDVE